MSNINRVTLLGNVGKNEVRYTPNGLCVVSLNIATQEVSKDKDKETKESDWHRVVCFGGLGEKAREHGVKGAKVFIEGKLKTRKWQDKQTGQDRYITEIHATTFQIITKTYHPAATPVSTIPEKISTPSNEFDEWIGEDLPF